MTTPGTCNQEDEAYLLLADPPHYRLLIQAKASAVPAVEELKLHGQVVAARDPSALGPDLANNKQNPVPMHLEPEVAGDRWLTTMGVEPWPFSNGGFGRRR